MLCPEPPCKRQKTQNSAVLLAMSKLHAVLLCIYLQTSDLVLSRAKSHMYLNQEDTYAPVLDELGPECEDGEFVLGHMAQGVVKPFSSKDPDGKLDEYSIANQEAAFVRTNWIFSHLLMRSEGEESTSDAPHIRKAVRLVDRAAHTMRWVSGKMEERAHALAKLLGIVPEAEAAAVAKLVPEHPLQIVSHFHRLPFDFQHGYACQCKNLLALDEKSEALLDFENTVCEVFGFRVCDSGPHYMKTSDVVINNTGLRKTYKTMTKEERETSGSVKMTQLIEDLLAKDDLSRVERAINGALVASRGLRTAARMLEEACDRFKPHVGLA
jgi:hypothetical protein